jgi:hypothetical protein
MAHIVYLLCALTSLACAALLLRSYRATRARLLLWSGLAFTGVFLNNLLLFIDTRLVPSIDLSNLRALPALIGMILLLYGLVWETRS